MIKGLDSKEFKSLVELAVKEDINTGDSTSEAIFTGTEISSARIVSKDEGVFCGIDVIKFIYNYFDPGIEVLESVKDGDKIIKGTEVVKINGSTKKILTGERTVLNFIQRMCGIATRTAYFVSLVENTDIKILDTRKTVPGHRMLDKYSVRMGGGTNHRIGLYDMIMIKDNHVKAAGSIKSAVEKVREKNVNNLKIEVETTNLEEVKEAADSDVHIIMLDNMSYDLMKESIDIIKGRTEVEVSGNIDEKRINEIKDLKIDYISIGALTHSVKAFDLSMKFD